jgi:hypothetical protein
MSDLRLIPMNSLMNASRYEIDGLLDEYEFLVQRMIRLVTINQKLVKSFVRISL